MGLSFRRGPTRAAFAVLLVAATAVTQPGTLHGLLDEYTNERVFSQQLEIGVRIANLDDPAAVAPLEPYLTLDDRHLRGNAAFVLARLGDPRGLEVLAEMLGDRSARGPGQGIPGIVITFSSDGRFDPQALQPTQIRADRYYAVHLLGRLKDRRAVDTLVPFLDDGDVNYNVTWALGEIGDRRAIPALINALYDPDALVRSSAVDALVKLEATEALPALRSLVDDAAMPRAGGYRVSVGTTARIAIDALQ